MARSLSLAAYRALSRRSSAPDDAPAPPRPEGEIIWAHATSPMRYSAICDLGSRLKSQRPGVRLLITIEKDRFERPEEMSQPADWTVRLDSDHPGAAQRFLTHWAPSTCLWTGGELMPNLISTASTQEIPMILLDVGETDFSTRRHKWFPDLVRSSLDCFDVIMTNSDAADSLLRRQGIPEEKISVTSQLRNCVSPPPCDEDTLNGIAQDLKGRQVWLAAGASAVEFDAIIAAHRAALRLLHRLLLVIAIADKNDLPLLREKLSANGLRSAPWDIDEIIEDNTQVVISDNPADLGIWFRVAPLTFMAESLDAQNAGRNPLEAAALGSALLYGPNVANHLEAYSRLAAAGAARTVNDAETLGAAVVQLIAPDHAAAMAVAGWVVATEGAQLTDQLLNLVQDMMDQRAAMHART